MMSVFAKCFRLWVILLSAEQSCTTMTIYRDNENISIAFVSFSDTK